MKANRTIYFNFDYIIIALLSVCISIEIVSLFLDNELFNFGAKLSIIFGLLLLIVCVKRGVGGYPFMIFTIFLILFFVQRIILLSINPDTFVYPIEVDASDINDALLFLFYSIIVILLGFSVGIAFSSMKRSKRQSYLSGIPLALPPRKFPEGLILIDPPSQKVRGCKRLHLNYGILTTSRYRDAWIKMSYVFLFTHLFVLLYLRQGFGVLPPDEYGWIFRPIRVVGVLFLGNILLLMQSHIKLSDFEKKALKIFIALYVGSLIISGSRSALLAIPVAVMFVKLITGDARFKAKSLILLSLIIPLLTVYVVVINAYREFLQTSFMDSSVSLTSIIDYNSLLNKISLTDVIEFFSRRMNGFDLLVAALKKQSELSIFINIKYQVLTIIDSLYPGSLFEHGTDPGLVIPLVLRNIDMSTYVFGREHMHLIGMSSVYFGYFGGLIFLFLFFFITALILFSKVNEVIKLIIANTLIFYTFETGFLDGLFQNLSEQLVMYGIVVIFISSFRLILNVIVKGHKTDPFLKTCGRNYS